MAPKYTAGLVRLRSRHLMAETVAHRMNASHVGSMKRLPCLVAGALLLVATSGCNDPLAPECGPAGFADCWEFLGLEGERAYSLVDTERGLYAGTREGGVFRYDHEFRSWESLGLDHAAVWDLVYFTPPDRLLAAVLQRDTGQPTGAAIFASDDGGESWFPSDGGRGEALGGYAGSSTLIEDPQRPGRVYNGGSGNVFRSDDYGHEWEVVNGSITPRGGAFWASHISNDDILYVGGSDAFTYTVVIWTNDGGETWEGKSPYGSFVNNEVLSLLSDPAKPRRLYATVIGEILRSDDGGRSWEMVYAPRSAGLRPEVWALVLVNDVLYAAAKERVTPRGEPEELGIGLYASRMGKENWESLRVPTTGSGALSMIQARDGSLIIGTTSGVWRVRM